jgi:hypothetical protein
MIVTSLADDVLDSMHPRDTDGDGVVEERGPLGNSGEALECFLPDDERERRAKSAKHVRWAINVSSENWNFAEIRLMNGRSMSVSTYSCWLRKASQQSGPALSLSLHP